MQYRLLRLLQGEFGGESRPAIVRPRQSPVGHSRTARATGKGSARARNGDGLQDRTHLPRHRQTGHRPKRQAIGGYSESHRTRPSSGIGPHESRTNAFRAPRAKGISRQVDRQRSGSTVGARLGFEGGAGEPAFYETFRVSPSDSEGRFIYDLGNGQWDIPHLRQLLENVLPDNNVFNDVEVEHEFENIGRRIMLLNGRRLDHLDLILLAIRDVTELRRLEAQQHVLVGELHHRIKNILTSVRALASQIIRESGSLNEFKSAFQERLDALARTQDLLLSAPERDTGLADVLRMEFEAQGGREGINFHLAGPEVLLTPRDAQAFSMAIHELVTNAIKYGALASPTGKVTIDWSVSVEADGDAVRFHWREHCERIDVVPDHRGYGTRVVESIFRHSLRGTSTLTLHADGAELVAEFRPSSV